MIMLNEKGMKNNKMTVSARETDGKTVFSAYWTTVEVTDYQMAVRFRFPMKFGMLRAAEWAEKEMHEAADRYAEGDSMQTGINLRLFQMMPYHTGKRKLLHRVGKMVLTLGMHSFQIEMVMSRSKDRLSVANDIDDTIERMAEWMRMNAYILQLQ